MQDVQTISKSEAAKLARRKRQEAKIEAAAVEAVVEVAAVAEVEPEPATSEKATKPKLTPEERIALKVAQAQERAIKAELAKMERKAQRDAALEALAKLEDAINGVADQLQDKYIGDQNVMDAEMREDGALLVLGNGKRLAIILKYEN